MNNIVKKSHCLNPIVVGYGRRFRGKGCIEEILQFTLDESIFGEVKKDVGQRVGGSVANLM